MPTGNNNLLLSEMTDQGVTLLRSMLVISKEFHTILAQLNVSPKIQDLLEQETDQVIEKYLLTYSTKGVTRITMPREVTDLELGK